MQITVVGSGAIGSAIAYDLCRSQSVRRVQMCDTRQGVLLETEAHVGSPKLRPIQVNARDQNALASIMRGSACVVSCVAPELNPSIARAAVSVGSHFCDLGGRLKTIEATLALADEARSQGVWVVPGCGLAPGLANVLCMHGIRSFDEVEAVRVRVGEVPLELNPPFNFQISFSAEKLIEAYTTPVTLIRDGEIVMAEPLTGAGPIHFGEPYGTLERFYSASGLAGLPQRLEGVVDTLDYRQIAYPGHAEHMRFLIALGLAELRSIDVRTTRTYREVLIRQLRKNIPADQPDAVLLRVAVSGTRDGRRQTYLAQLIDTYNEAEQMTAMKRGTGFSASIVAQMLVARDIPGGGAAPPEEIIPAPEFLDELRARGLAIDESWHDGEIDIDQENANP